MQSVSFAEMVENKCVSVSNLTAKSVVLNDLERPNGRVFCVISPTSVAFGTYYVKVVAR